MQPPTERGGKTCSRAAASILGPEAAGVTVQICCPGVVATEFHTRQGMDLSAVPRMSAEEVVAASLRGLDLGEVVCAPGVENTALLDAVFSADLAAFGAQSPQLASRYDGFGRLDALVANAGVATVAPLAEGTLTDWNTMIDVNLRGVLHGIAAVLPCSPPRDPVTSTPSPPPPPPSGFPGRGVYAATKAGVRALCEVLRQEAGAEIRATMICPRDDRHRLHHRPATATATSGDGDGARRRRLRARAARGRQRRRDRDPLRRTTVAGPARLPGALCREGADVGDRGVKRGGKRGVVAARLGEQQAALQGGEGDEGKLVRVGIAA